MTKFDLCFHQNEQEHHNSCTIHNIIFGYLINLIWAQTVCNFNETISDHSTNVKLHFRSSQSLFVASFAFPIVLEM